MRYTENAEHCVCCGKVIPEGNQVCVICGMGKVKKHDAERMTAKEALNTLDETFIGNLKLKIALSKFLEKQIPEKPIITALNVYCPKCNHDLGKERAKREAISNFKYFGYCSACGQALSWEVDYE